MEVPRLISPPFRSFEHNTESFVNFLDLYLLTQHAQHAIQEAYKYIPGPNHLFQKNVRIGFPNIFITTLCSDRWSQMSFQYEIAFKT